MGSGQQTAGIQIRGCTHSKGRKKEGMTHTGNHIRLLIECEKILSTAMLEVAKRHKDDAEAVAGLKMLSAWSALHATELQPLTKRYKGQPALRGRVFRS